ncbi:MAG: nucleotide-binding universal stress UspA family protein [Luteibaculaceae bacterium]|jgi:nucleotide-binding universal stress UspA family protein
MKKIIVPTDFSDCAENALHVAADIARKSKNAEIHLVHVYERPISGISLKFYIDTVELQKVKEFIQSEMTILCQKDFLKGLEVKKHFYGDQEIHDIPNLSVCDDADLIVMGTHGSSGWREFFIGSNTQKLIRIANCPVLAIKQRHEEFKVENLVFASNFYGEADNSFEKVKSLIELFEAKIHLLTVNTQGQFEPTKKSRNLMTIFANKCGLTNFSTHVFNDETVEEGILHFSEEINPDLIIIETHGRSGIAELLNPSITGKVVNHIWRPVVSIKMDHR